MPPRARLALPCELCACICDQVMRAAIERYRPTNEFLGPDRWCEPHGLKARTLSNTRYAHHWYAAALAQCACTEIVSEIRAKLQVLRRRPATRSFIEYT